MANPEHLKILKQGVDVWNKWREENSNIYLDLSNANLSNANLRYTNLRDANLLCADLAFANLRHANMRNADLRHANLHTADLRHANLRHANLSNSSLSNAILLYADLRYAILDNSSLSYADLEFANLDSTSLKDTDFNNAIVGGTIFTSTDLRGVVGLETVIHWSPSEIGISTIYISEGKISEIFLRGCGVPDEFITYMHSLVAHPIEFYSCFISYSSRDQDFAERLYADLQNKGVRCWYAPEDLKIGDRIRDRIDESIRLRDKLLIILSENSIASEWVEHEVESALEEEKRKGRAILFPVRIDDAVMESQKAWAALIRRTRHIGDFTRWKEHDPYQKAFDRLLRDLKAEEKKS